MKILLINANRYNFPPVIPAGLEYLYGHLEKSRHKAFILDLCFSGNPLQELKDKINEIKPDIAGISIRHIDTVLYQNNEFFIYEVKEFVEICKNLNLKVILGGAGYSIMPEEILNYTGADYGVCGPGELALERLLDQLEGGEIVPQITNGFSFFTGNRYEFLRSKVIDYSEYIDNDGIVGFRTQTGCTDNCFFCTEGKKQIIYNTPESVGREISELKQGGYSHFHLCDSEFNLNTDHCINVCKAIIEYAGPVNWTLYMKPEPFSADMFMWLEKSGATLITLSIDTKTSGVKSFKRLAEFFRLANKEEIKIAVDLSIGYPYEELQQTKAMIDFLSGQPAETVGVNSIYRVYPGTPLYNIIIKDQNLEKYLINRRPGINYLFPVFYSLFSLKQVRELIGNNPKFRIEGFDRNTNYQRVN
ncbi:MAG: cobalamin-dependent protein [Bacteroidales bacterium]|nr:MAG: cobalamin-dependent protein [Bacteroidales bacterium]